MKSMEERFWPKVAKGGPGECWIWAGAKTHKGYGMFRPGGSAAHHLAHRASYEMEVGPIPPGLYVMHKCDNPSCVRPDHLQTGTAWDNMQDKVQKGRGRWLKGSEVGNAKLTESQVCEILRRLDCGEFQRVVAADFGVSQSAISHIRTGRGWRQLSHPD